VVGIGTSQAALVVGLGVSQAALMVGLGVSQAALMVGLGRSTRWSRTNQWNTCLLKGCPIR